MKEIYIMEQLSIDLVSLLLFKTISTAASIDLGLTCKDVQELCRSCVVSSLQMVSSRLTILKCKEASTVVSIDLHTYVEV